MDVFTKSVVLNSDCVIRQGLFFFLICIIMFRSYSEGFDVGRGYDPKASTSSELDLIMFIRQTTFYLLVLNRNTGGSYLKPSEEV